jgi:hypothetical protein
VTSCDLEERHQIVKIVLRQQVCLKLPYLSTELHHVTSCKVISLIPHVYLCETSLILLENKCFFFINNKAAKSDGRETVLVCRKQEEQNERDKMMKHTEEREK